MTILDSIILGIIEGFTEFLPISSTGHLILASQILKISQTDFLKSFEIIIQLGAISSVIVLYFKSLIKTENLKKIIVAFVPTGIIGLSLYGIIKNYLMENINVVLWSLFIGGLIFILFELFRKNKENLEEIDNVDIEISKMSYKKAFIIGLFQAISIIPGVSRSAATIIGGLIVGIGRKTIVEFSFLLAVPTMLIASTYDLTRNYSLFSNDNLFILIIGFLTSFIVAVLAIKFFIKFVKNHTFITFGVYRIVIATIIGIYFLI